MLRTKPLRSEQPPLILSPLSPLVPFLRLSVLALEGMWCALENLWHVLRCHNSDSHRRNRGAGACLSQVSWGLFPQVRSCGAPSTHS